MQAQLRLQPQIAIDIKSHCRDKYTIKRVILYYLEREEGELKAPGLTTKPEKKDTRRTWHSSPSRCLHASTLMNHTTPSSTRELIANILGNKVRMRKKKGENKRLISDDDE